MGCVSAQSLRYAIVLPYTGVAAYSTQQNDPLSFTTNQAALAKTEQAGFGMYTEKRFLLDATTYYTLAMAIPTHMGNFGVQLNYSGFKNFNENTIGLAYARSIGKRVDVGIQFNYYGYRIPSYSNAATVFVEAGAIVHFSSKLNGAFHIYNPAGGKLSNGEDEKLASAYTFGLGYDVSNNFLVSGTIIKEDNMPVNMVSSVQYQFAAQFFAKLGFISESSSIFTGVGAGFKKIRIDITASYHPQLGISPGILFIACFGNK
jgi:hypothetical protein